MRSVRILEEAAQEAIEAAAWYESEESGLGAEFSHPVDAAIGVIAENVIPLSPLPKEAGITTAKRLILERFPYDIVAIEMRNEAVVVAVAHHSRKPGYWQRRHAPTRTPDRSRTGKRRIPRRGNKAAVTQSNPRANCPGSSSSVCENVGLRTPAQAAPQEPIRRVPVGRVIRQNHAGAGNQGRRLFSQDSRGHGQLSY